jgi:hypothetical protein
MCVRVSLQETLHFHNGSNESTDNVEAAEVGSSESKKDKMIEKDESLFLNWPLMSSIIVYCLFSLHDITYQEVIFHFMIFLFRPSAAYINLFMHLSSCSINWRFIEVVYDNTILLFN